MMVCLLLLVKFGSVGCLANSIDFGAKEMEVQPSEHMILCNIPYQNKQVLSYPKEWKGSSVLKRVFF